MKTAILFFLSILLGLAPFACAAGSSPEHRTYTGYVERWKSVGTYRYALMDQNGDAIVYIGDDYPNDLGNDKKCEVRECLNEAMALGVMVEIGGEWIQLPEGAEGLDEQTISCKLLK